MLALIPKGLPMEYKLSAIQADHLKQRLQSNFLFQQLQILLKLEVLGVSIH